MIMSMLSDNLSESKGAHLSIDFNMKNDTIM